MLRFTNECRSLSPSSLPFLSILRIWIIWQQLNRDYLSSVNFGSNKFIIGVLDVVNISSKIPSSSCRPHFYTKWQDLLSNQLVTRSALELCLLVHVYIVVLTRISSRCLLDCSSWSLTHLELGCSLSFHRHVIHGMCYVLSVCAKYGIVYWIKKSSLRKATGYTSFHIMLSATLLQSILNVNISELSTHRSHYILTMYLLTILDTYSVQGCQPAHNWIPSFSLCYLRIQVV